MELYKTFYYVATLGGFSKAASELFVSQSAVSQAVSLLEKNLGVKLFIRKPRGIALTDEGQVLLNQVEPAIASIRTGEKSIKSMVSLDEGMVTISASDTFCMYLFPSYIEKFSKTYPGIALNIANKTSSETKQLLLKYDADIGIINLHNDNEEKLKIWKRYVINDCFIMKKNSISLNKQLSPKEIAGLNHIMLEKGTSTRAHIDSYFSQAGLEVEPGIELGSVELLIRFASMGMGVSCVAREFLENSAYRDMVDIVPAQIPVQQRSIGVVTLNGNPISRAADAFLKIFMEEE